MLLFVCDGQAATDLSGVVSYFFIFRVDKQDDHLKIKTRSINPLLSEGQYFISYCQNGLDKSTSTLIIV